MMTAAERKEHPLYSGVLKYFPDALMAVAHLSKIGNDQHNPGQPLHWAKEKSTDHGDCIMRHLKDAGTLDADGERHSAKVAWRALALLQTEIDTEKVQSPPQAIPFKGDTASIDPVKFSQQDGLGCCAASRKVLSECHCEPVAYEESPAPHPSAEAVLAKLRDTYAEWVDDEKAGYGQLINLVEDCVIQSTAPSPQADGDSR